MAIIELTPTAARKALELLGKSTSPDDALPDFAHVDPELMMLLAAILNFVKVTFQANCH